MPMSEVFITVFFEDDSKGIVGTVVGSVYHRSKPEEVGFESKTIEFSVDMECI